MRARLVAAAVIGAAAVVSHPAQAQQPDTRELEKRYGEFYAAKNYTAALEEAEKLAAAFKAQVGTDHINYAIGQRNVAAALFQLRRFAEAEKLFAFALPAFEKKYGPTDKFVSSVLSSLATAYSEQNKWADAEKTFKRLVTIYEGRQPAEQERVWWALYDQAVANTKLQNFSEAEKLLIRALALPEQVRGKDAAEIERNSRALVAELEKIGIAYIDKGRASDAEQALRPVVSVRERFLGDSHPLMAPTYGNLAISFKGQNKYEQAEQFFRRAIAIQDKKPGMDKPWQIEILRNLADVCTEQKKFSEAETFYARALGILEAGSAGNGSAALQIRRGIVFNLMAMASGQLDKGNSDEALPIYQRIVPLLESMNTPASHLSLIAVLNDIGTIHRTHARYSEAATAFKQAIALEEKSPSGNPAFLPKLLAGLADTAMRQGNYAETLALHTKSSALAEQRFGLNSVEFGATLSNIGTIEVQQGRYAEAEQYLQRALAIFEKKIDTPDLDIWAIYNNLAVIHLARRDFPAARALFGRALLAREKRWGADHPDIAESLRSLAAVEFADGGDPVKGEALLRRAIAMDEKALGPNHPNVAKSIILMTQTTRDGKKFSEELVSLQRALAIMEKTYGPNHAEVAKVLDIIGLSYSAEGKPAEAIPYLRRASAVREKTLGPDHLEFAAAIDHLSGAEYAQGNYRAALDYSRRATKILLARAAIESSILNEADESKRSIENRSAYLNSHLNVLQKLSQTPAEATDAIAQEAFDLAQWMTQSSAASALQQMSARSAIGDGALAKMVREKQDLAALRRNQDKALLDARSDAKTDRSVLDQLTVKTEETDRRLTAISGRIAKEFPDYASLTGAAPLKVSEVQGLLGADEAMVFFLNKKYRTHIFVLTPERFLWTGLTADEELLSKAIANFRRGLDVGQLQRSLEVSGKPDLFDLNRAHDLYKNLLGNLEPIIKNKQHLLIVATGSLTALPFHLLVTEKPAASAGTQLESAAYRDAAWLLKRHAITVLPSVGSLKALRGLAGKNPAGKPMIGFGDPVFAPEQLPAPTRVAQSGAPAQPAATKAAAPVQSKPTAAAKTKTAGKTRAYSDYWQGAGVDPDNLTQALPALPDTADELKAIAKKLGVPPSDILLGRAANEAAVKRAPLADYRIVYFATHGLVAGDIKGVGEPSLALSLPSKPSDLDDGLLTASEISQLKLNADWVVLSACNTIAGDKPGAEALSGLARSFFYAGARALLVTHWAVNSNAATVLTTSTFDILKAEPAVGRSEALRRAMLAYLNNPSDPLNAYPAMWGAFSVIGEGAAR